MIKKGFIMINNKTVNLIIPTRYNSTRLKDKVLIDIASKKQIEWIIERSLLSKYLDNIILSISNQQGKEIVEWWDRNDIYNRYNKKVLKCMGDYDDLLNRTLLAAEKFNTDIIVMASHDLTLIDYSIMDKLIERLVEYNADMSCNYITRTFPDGFDLAVHTIDIYKKINYIVPENHITRIWTSYNIFYWRESLFPKPKIINLEAEKEYYYPNWRLVLDTDEDLKLLEYILRYFNRIDFTYKEVIDFLLKNKHLLEINKSIIPTELLQEEVRCLD